MKNTDALAREIRLADGRVDTAESIDGAYGLVLGVFHGLLQSDAEAWAQWNRPEVQAAAMRAARAFISDVDAISGAKSTKQG